MFFVPLGEAPNYFGGLGLLAKDTLLRFRAHWQWKVPLGESPTIFGDTNLSTER